MFTTCSALNTPWPSWALPLAVTSVHLTTLGFNWASSVGVGTIASAIPVTGSHEGAGIQNLRGGGAQHGINSTEQGLT